MRKVKRKEKKRKRRRVRRALLLQTMGLKTSLAQKVLQRILWKKPGKKGKASSGKAL